MANGVQQELEVSVCSFTCTNLLYLQGTADLHKLCMPMYLFSIPSTGVLQHNVIKSGHISHKRRTGYQCHPMLALESQRPS